MALISVIVPVYKVEKYLKECLNSIIDQQFKDYDVILINDGSPDECGKICDSYATADTRFHVIHQENMGLSAARNSGIVWAMTHSDSSYLTFVDSDDLLDQRYLDTMVRQIEKNTADIVACEKQDFFDDKQRISKPIGKEELCCTGKEACIHLYSMDGILTLTAWGKLYRKELFFNVRFPVGKIHEDQAVIPIVMYGAEKVCKNSSVLYYYRRRPDSIMGSRFSAQRFNDVEGLEACRKYFCEERETKIVELIDTRIVTIQSLYSLYARQSGVYKEIPKKYRMSRCRALRNLEKNMSYDYFTWYVSQVYPKLVRPYSYWKKVKSMVGVEK